MLSLRSDDVVNGSWPHRSGALAAGVLAAVLIAGRCQATEAPVPMIAVEGEASADVVPDTAHLSLGIETERPTAAAASAELARAAQAVADAVRAEGIEPKDITTTSLALVPLYREDQARAPGAPPPRAFRAATAFEITIRPAERAGPIASQLIDKGANAVQGVDYSSSQAEARLDQLRADAVRDARRKAEIYVAALGLHLGRVVEVAPDSGGAFRAQPMPMRTAAQKSALPAAPGTLTLRAAVTIRWVIEP